MVQGIMSSIANFATLIVSYLSEPLLSYAKQTLKLQGMTQEYFTLETFLFTQRLPLDSNADSEILIGQ